MSTKGRSDYYAPGDYNACCDRCCAKFKASKLKRDWRGFMLCEWCWEPRHPQDFVRGLADPTPVPWTRQCSHDNIVTFCMTPTASFTVEVDPDDPLTINYASTTPSSEACPVTCEYDFGDGGTSTSCSGSHTYGAGGTYEINYTATNPGGSATTLASVTVEEPYVPPPEPCEYLVYSSPLTNGYSDYTGTGFPPNTPVLSGDFPPYLTFTNIRYRAVATNIDSPAYLTPPRPTNGGSSYIVNGSTVSSIAIDPSLEIRCVRFKLSIATGPILVVECTGADITIDYRDGGYEDGWLPEKEITVDPILNGIITKLTFTFTVGTFYCMSDLELRSYTP